MKCIIGVGNYSMFDDSIGLRIIEYIGDHNLNEGFEAIDLSGNTLNLLSYLSVETEKILIVDTAHMGLKPGEYKFFKPQDVKTIKKLDGMSTHEGDILKALDFAQEAGYQIPPVQIMGIEPESIRHEFGLSETLQKKIALYVNEAIREIQKK